MQTHGHVTRRLCKCFDWRKRKKPSALLWNGGVDTTHAHSCPQLSSPVHRRRHQQGSGLLMRVDFHNTHIVTTRYKDYHCDPAPRDLQQGNDRRRFSRVLLGLWCFEVFFSFFKVLAVRFRCVVQNKLRVVLGTIAHFFRGLLLLQNRAGGQLDV